MRTNSITSFYDIKPLPVPSETSTANDLEIARRLQMEEDARATFSSPSISTLQDEALARRMDQELRDHQYAQNLQHHEQNNNTSPVSLPPIQGVVVQQEEQAPVIIRRRRYSYHVDNIHCFPIHVL
jgi:hypothetical protein